MEDIPQGVTAVLTESTTDVLSHVAIRARSQGVLLATCFDDAEWQRLTAMQVRWLCSRCCLLVQEMGLCALCTCMSVRGSARTSPMSRCAVSMVSGLLLNNP